MCHINRQNALNNQKPQKKHFEASNQENLWMKDSDEKQDSNLENQKPHLSLLVIPLLGIQTLEKPKENIQMTWTI